jgi:negative regulator of replication initiation
MGKLVRLVFEVDAEVYRNLKAYCKKDGKNIEDVLRNLLRNFMDDQIDEFH